MEVHNRKHRRHQPKHNYVPQPDKKQSLSGKIAGWQPHGSNLPILLSQTCPMAAFPHSSRESPNSQGPLWPRASDFLQVMLSPASTLPAFTLVHLTHTTASAENPSKLYNMSSWNACCMPKRGDNFSYRYQTLSISTIFGTKEGGKALGDFLAALQACIRPWQREALPEDEEEEDYG